MKKILYLGVLMLLISVVIITPNIYANEINTQEEPTAVPSGGSIRGHIYCNVYDYDLGRGLFVRRNIDIRVEDYITINRRDYKIENRITIDLFVGLAYSMFAGSNMADIIIVGFASGILVT